MKKIIIVLFFSIFSFVYSQNSNSLKIEVVDSISQLPINDGNIFLINDTDSVYYSSFKKNGFVISCNEYLSQFKKIKISSNHFSDFVFDINNYNCFNDEKIILKMLPATIEIKEVIIKAPLIIQDIEKIVYNVSSDPDSKNLMLLDFLPKLPFISLSPDDNPLYKGKTNFVVLLNGKSSSLFSSNNLRDALKSLDASTIEKIEIITDPPLRYQNEGAIGVLNIITKKNEKDGYKVSINSNIGTFISGVNSSLNFSKNNLGIIFQLSNNYERVPYNKSSIFTKNKDLSINSLKENKINNSFLLSNILLSYELNPTSVLNVDFGFDYNNIKNSSINHDILTYLNHNSPSKYSFNSTTENDNNAYNLNLNFQKNFTAHKDKLFALSYSYRNNINNNNFTVSPIKLDEFELQNKIQNSYTKNTQNIFQIDYILPINNLKIESGSKYINRISNSDFNKDLSDSLYLNDRYNDYFKNNTSILSIYNSLFYKFNSFSFRMGLRYEFTYFKNIYSDKYLDFERNYNNLLPLIRMSYKSKKNLLFSLGFKQSIQRPGITLLNPMIINNSPYFARTGNPDLKPVLLNSITTEFSKYKKSSISIAFNYTFSKNTIQSTTDIIDSIIITSFSNIGKYNKMGLDVSFETPIIENKLDFSVDGSLYYVNTYVKGNNEIKNNGFEGFAYSYLTYKLKKLNIFSNIGYYGPTVNIQANSNSYLYSSLGLSKSLFKDNANISFRLINPFQKNRKTDYVIKNEELFQHSIQNTRSRGFYLSFNYKFGKLKNNIKQNKKKIQIDDTANETGKIQ